MVQTFISADLLGGFGINPWAFLSQLVSFGIIFLVLWRWGFPAILKTLEQRQAVIREGIENAERAKNELNNAKQQADQLRLEASRKAQEISAQITKNAEAEANRIIEEAHTRAEQIGKQEVARIQQEAARARAEIGRLVINLSINAASKVISKSVDSKDNRRLVEEFVQTSQAREQ